jgi:hypothetical protein
MILVELYHMDLSIFAANKEKVPIKTLFLTKIDFCNSGLLVLFHQLKHTLFYIDMFFEDGDLA